MTATRAGDIWGFVHFSRNFSSDYALRLNDGRDASNDTIIGSRIGVHVDMSNQQVAFTIERYLFKTFELFSKELMKACDFEEQAANMALTVINILIFY